MSFATATQTPTPTEPANTDPAFVGWSLSAVLDGTSIYTSVDCPTPSTLYTSGEFATCCASNPCNLYTACVSESIVVGPTSTQTCASPSGCFTTSIFQDSGDSPFGQNVFCDTVGPNNWEYYRSMPSDGIANTNTTAVAYANKHDNILGIGLGAGLGGFVSLLVIAAIWVFCGYCLTRRGGPRGPLISPPAPMSSMERRWQETQLRNEIANDMAATARDHADQDRRNN